MQPSRLVLEDRWWGLVHLAPSAGLINFDGLAFSLPRGYPQQYQKAVFYLTAPYNAEAITKVPKNGSRVLRMSFTSCHSSHACKPQSGSSLVMDPLSEPGSYSGLKEHLLIS